MPEYLAPGVYVEEIERGPKPIEGVATSTAAFLGATERGPSRPRLVTSYSEYLRYFGGIFAESAYVPYAVRMFFDNGGRRAYIARISGANAATATVDVAGFTLTAIGVGAAFNRVQVRTRSGAPRRTAPATRSASGCGSGTGTRPAPNVPYDRGAVPAGAQPPGPEPSATEDFDDLSIDPNSPSYFLKRVNGVDPERWQLLVRRDRRRGRRSAGAPRRPGIGAARRWRRRRRAHPARLPR